MLLVLFSIVVGTYSFAYAPPPSLPAAPNPYGTPLKMGYGQIAPEERVEIVPEEIMTTSSFLGITQSDLIQYATTRRPIATASPPPPQAPQTFDEFSSNIGELDLDWNQLLESTTISPSTNTFEPTNNNIALTLTGEEQANFVDRLNEISNNTSAGIDTFHRTPEFDELNRNSNTH